MYATCTHGNLPRATRPIFPVHDTESNPCWGWLGLACETSNTSQYYLHQVFVQITYRTHLIYVLLSSKEFYGCMRQVKTSPMKLNLVAKLVSDIELVLCLAL